MAPIIDGPDVGEGGAVTKLGELLAELTRGLSPAEIHAVIAGRLQQPDYDQRLASLIAEESAFETMWTALQQGGPLPESAWETIVLPVIVAFSDQQALKAHLERATSLWLGTGDVGLSLPHATIDGEVLAVTGGAVAIGQSSPRPALTSFPTTDLGSGAAKRRWPLLLATALTVAALAAAAGFWSTRGEPATNGELPPLSFPTRTLPQEQSATPGAATTAEPVALPTAGTGPVVEMTPSTQPPPSPTWNGSGPAVAPGVPLGLSLRSVTTTTVALGWLPPADPGSGEVAYYRVFRDGADTGWTDHTSATITRLTPGTTYTFHVVAYNTAGLASPHSGSLSVTTCTTVTPTTSPPARVFLAISPQPTVALGDSFTVAGTGWPCSAPATVRILLGGQAVAVAALDAAGAFSAPIAVDNSEPTPQVGVLESSEHIGLTKGTWQVTAELTSQPACAVTATKSVQITFRDRL